MKLLISSGRGPAECRQAVLRTVMLMRAEADRFGLNIELVDDRWPDKMGPSSSVAVLDGDGVEVFAQSWIGSIQHVARSELRPGHGRKNWFVGVSVLPDDADEIILHDRDVRFEAFRSGGPGGQHQNTTSSAVRATHLISNLSVVVRSERSQHQNKRIALKRLAELLTARRSFAQGQIGDIVREQHDRVLRGSPIRTIKA